MWVTVALMANYGLIMPKDSARDFHTNSAIGFFNLYLMLHAYVQRFDVMFLKKKRTKQVLIIRNAIFTRGIRRISSISVRSADKSYCQPRMS